MIFLLYFQSVLSGYGRGCLDNELDMELNDDEEIEGFTEDRWDRVTIMLLPAYTLVHKWASVLHIYFYQCMCVLCLDRDVIDTTLFSPCLQVPQSSLCLTLSRWKTSPCRPNM